MDIVAFVFIAWSLERPATLNPKYSHEAFDQNGWGCHVVVYPIFIHNTTVGCKHFRFSRSKLTRSYMSRYGLSQRVFLRIQEKSTFSTSGHIMAGVERVLAGVGSPSAPEYFVPDIRTV